MIKSGYLESIYYRDGLIHKTSELEDSIRKLLTENHGVGILGGTYDDGFPLCMVSELTDSQVARRSNGRHIRIHKRRKCRNDFLDNFAV